VSLKRYPLDDSIACFVDDCDFTRALDGFDAIPWFSYGLGNDTNRSRKIVVSTDLPKNGGENTREENCQKEDSHIEHLEVLNTKLISFYQKSDFL